MSDKQTYAIKELKIQAKKQLKLSRFEEETNGQIEKKSLKHYLQLVSTIIGFESWQHANGILSKRVDSNQNNDFGAFFHHRSCNALVNEWFSDYREAVKSCYPRDDCYLLPYKKQFVVVRKDYLFAIGLVDKDFVLIDGIKRDWVAGYGSEPWDRLASLIIRRRFE
jgi:hypothetical protein